MVELNIDSLLELACEWQCTEDGDDAYRCAYLKRDADPEWTAGDLLEAFKNWLVFDKGLISESAIEPFDDELWEHFYAGIT
jgi:hypothetical protein